MQSYFKLKKKTDLSIPTVGIILSLVGLVMVLSASQITAGDKFGNPYYYFVRQLISWVIGAGVFFYLLKLPIERLYEKRSVLLSVTLVLLFLVFMPVIGPRIANVHRWINLGIFQLQSAEVAKLLLLIYFSAWFAARGEQIKDPFKTLIPFMLLLGLVTGLIILEPDMGTALVIVMMAMSLFFVARANLIQYLSLFLIGILLLVTLIYAAPYRAQRITSFISKSDSSHDVLGAGYHTQQALIAIGSGGLWGKGFGQGTSKYAYLPQAHTDSIFAVIAEELGFIRSTLILLAYIFLGWRSYTIATTANSRFVQLLSVGIGVLFISQMLLNVGGMLNVIPLTGVPLPFISYGGSSLIVSMALLGLLTNISREVNA